MNARSKIATLGVVNGIVRGNKNKRKTELLSYFTVFRKKSLSSEVLRGGKFSTHVFQMSLVRLARDL